MPGTIIDRVWLLNPRGHEGLITLGSAGIILMSVVCVACALATRGIAKRVRWGHRLAVTILTLNVLADLVNGTLLGDRRTLIGVPVGGALIAYLLTARVRLLFHQPDASTLR